MTNNMKRILTTVLLLVLSISMFIIPVQAGDYAPEVTVPVTVELTGHLPQVADKFEIKLTAKNAAFPMPSGAVDGAYTMVIEAPDNADGTPGSAGTGNLTITFSKPGVYTYTIEQLPGTNEDCYQDSTKYNVTIFITNTENYDGFNYNVAIYKQGPDGQNVGGKVPVVFANRYAMPAEIKLTAIKTLDSKTPKDGLFSFKLADTEGKTIQEVKNDGKDVTFETISLYKEGKYTYKMSEIKGNNKKYTYDTTVYTVNVDVKKDDNGDYKAAVSYKKGTKDYEGTPKFANYTTKTDNPTTGDMFRMGLWITVMGVSLAAVVALVVIGLKKKKKHEENNNN